LPTVVGWKVTDVSAQSHSSTLVRHQRRAIVPSRNERRSARQGYGLTVKGVERGHSVAQGCEGASPKRAIDEVGDTGVDEWGVVSDPVAQDGLPPAIPVEVEGYNNTAASQVHIQVIAQRGLVCPAYIAPGYDDLVWLQLG
jgi:hypothetical protein